MEIAKRTLQKKSRRPWTTILSGLRVERQRRLQEFNNQLNPLIREITRRQAKGEEMQYSMHIYREIRWRLNFTPDTAATAALITKLKTSLYGIGSTPRAS